MDISKMEAHREAEKIYRLGCITVMTVAEAKEKQEVYNETWDALSEEEKEMVLFFDANNRW